MANIVVTGASKGIGKSIAEIFASNGHNLAICSRHIDDLEKLRSEIQKFDESSEILVKECDVSVKSDIEEFAGFIIDSFGQIDVLVNNAGIFFPGKITDEEDGAYERMMKTNMDSVYYMTRAFLLPLLNSNKGHIFNLCSVAGLQAYPDSGSYTISKFALLGFSRSLREELKGQGVRVTSVIPGATYTASWEGTDIPENRFMKAEDIAKMVYEIYALSPQTVVEDIVLRPMLGDI